MPTEVGTPDTRTPTARGTPDTQRPTELRAPDTRMPAPKDTDTLARSPCPPLSLTHTLSLLHTHAHTDTHISLSLPLFLSLSLDLSLAGRVPRAEQGEPGGGWVVGPVMRRAPATIEGRARAGTHPHSRPLSHSLSRSFTPSLLHDLTLSLSHWPGQVEWRGGGERGCEGAGRRRGGGGNVGGGGGGAGGGGRFGRSPERPEPVDSSGFRVSGVGFRISRFEYKLLVESFVVGYRFLPRPHPRPPAHHPPRGITSLSSEE